MAYFSDGGLYILPSFSESSMSFLTASKIGFFYDSNSSNLPGAIKVLSWYLHEHVVLACTAFSTKGKAAEPSSDAPLPGTPRGRTFLRLVQPEMNGHADRR
jgi:hypothetical protein